MKKILVVDDDKILCDAIEFTLASDGFDVITAEDGFSALKVIDNQMLDLIICDIMMPNLSGLSLLSILKQYNCSKIPVILISSLDKADVISSSLGLGATDFITKPINFEELSCKVKKLTTDY